MSRPIPVDRAMASPRRVLCTVCGDTVPPRDARFISAPVAALQRDPDGRTWAGWVCAPCLETGPAR